MIVCDKCMTNPADLGTIYVEVAGNRQGIDICRDCFRKMFSDIEVARKAFCAQVNFDKDDRGSVEEELLAEKNREMLKDVPSRINGMIIPQFMPSEVVIGNQTWLLENLKVDDGKGGIYHNEDNGEVYYTFDAAKRVADGIPGWHLPSRDEWNTLIEVTGTYEDSKPLMASGTNTTGLTVKLVGSKIESYGRGAPKYYVIDKVARFWSSDEEQDYPESAWYKYFDSTSGGKYDFNGPKDSGLSVRLVKDS